MHRSETNPIARATTMKFFILASTLPTLALGYSIHGHGMVGRPAVTILEMGLSPMQAPPPPRPSRRQAQQKRDVDQAFDDLMTDLHGSDGENAVSKSKEWVDRSFGLISELNRDVALSEDEVQRNEEMLRKQQKWANKVIDFATELGRDLNVRQGQRSSSDDGGNDQEKPPAVSRGTVVAPLYSIKDDATIFQVELEVPGVSLGDIDIELEKETNVLVISGERKSIGSDEPTKFSKRFMLEPLVNTDQITAQLTNGILTVSAPKEAKKDTGNTKKIPVVAGTM